MQIAIDGPAGAGKSTVAKRLADRLGYLYVDTGAMYRALTLAAMREGIAPEESEALTSLLAASEIALKTAANGVPEVYLNGENVSEDIRSRDVSAQVSRYSALADVRKKLTEEQKRLATDHDVVMDGRDIGSVVLPNADVKIYLTAGCEERARRRAAQMAESGQDVDLEALTREIAARDENDRNRVFAPLTKAADAVEINSDWLGIEDVLDKIMMLIQK